LVTCTSFLVWKLSRRGLIQVAMEHHHQLEHQCLHWHLVMHAQVSMLGLNKKTCCSSKKNC
jgi:hypothetical protein